MKKILCTVICIISVFTGYTQSLSGLIAHWNFNGNSLDVSGHGHNGTAHNVISTAGKSGIPGTGYYFNGIANIDSASYITVPYKSDMNLDHYSICATLKVSGFYTGICQGNMLLTRGKPRADGSYQLYFFDNPFNDCYTADTTQYVFATGAGNDLAADVTNWQYTPTISENKWYSIVVTYNDTAYKVYINGSLINTVPVVSHTSAVATMDSLSIGYDLFEASLGYPYPFKGIIDDMMLYNRVLTSSEINDYTSLDVKDIVQEQNALQISPNPAKEELYVNLNQHVKDAQLKIYNQLGQEVKRILLNGKQMQLSIKDLSAGIYFISVMNGDEIMTNKFVKE
ncbi:MAG: T9SS type A sorting domain-containing protein [Bacteroidetes bacterium]|nr:T9SS type A sorting domain-containing protein [Bacteroidota bacterium]